MNAMRYVGPFKDEVLQWISKLGEVSETIEKWLKVQVYWTNLFPVFTSGDISKQMPNETKRFLKSNKDWLRRMEAAHDTKNVLGCCEDEILKTQLPLL